MRISTKARMNRMFTNGGCLDVAIVHGVCNEPSFMDGLEDIGSVVDQLITAGPDAIQMNYGQADLLQSRPDKPKPALVMRIDMGNPYNDRRHRAMWSQLQNADEPIIGALEMDAAAVVVKLFMLPDEPDLFHDVVPVLQELATRYQLIALSNGNADLDVIGIRGYFDRVYGARELGFAKPDGDFFVAAAARCELELGELLHVGDHPQNDIVAAREAGMHVVWLNRDDREWPADEQRPEHEIAGLAELSVLLT